MFSSNSDPVNVVAGSRGLWLDFFGLLGGDGGGGLLTGHSCALGVFCGG